MPGPGGSHRRPAAPALLAAETERRRATAAVAAQRLSARLAGGTA